MSQLNANDLKTRGVAAIEAVLEGRPEAMISVRGKQRFVVMEIAHYHYLRECELDAALAQSQADVAAGRFVDESATAHVARLQALLGPGEVPAAAVRKATARKSAVGKPALGKPAVGKPAVGKPAVGKRVVAVKKKPAAKPRTKRPA